MEVREASARYLLKSGFKQTEVGLMPEDWRITPLGRLIGSVEYGSSAKSNAHGSTPVLRMGNILDGKIDWHDLVYSDNDVEIKKYNLKAGDVLFNRTNTIDLVGKTAIYKGERPAIYAGYLIRVNVDKSLLDSRFLNYVLNAEFSRKHSAKVLSVAVGQANINGQKLKTYPIPLPPTVAEQEAIAEALSDADALIESLEQLLAKKRNVKQGAMQLLLTGKKRLVGFSGDWKEKRLGNSATLKARIGWQGLTTAEYLDTGDYLLVTGTEFKGGRIDWNNCHYVEEPRYRQDKNIQLREHDVLVTKDGTIGKVALISHLTQPATLNSGVFVIRPVGDAFYQDFFYYLLCSNAFNEFLTQLSAGSTINHLYQKDFVGFIYKTPPTVEEQTAIATLLSDVDAEIATLETRLDKARCLKQGMMQDLLTGRIRLVRPVSNVVPFPFKGRAEATVASTHNKPINEAVIIGVLAKHFGTEEFPLPRKRRVKLMYLLHRHTEGKAEGYLKKAAGPYDPSVKYKGPESIAVKNGYVREHHNGKYPGFVAGEKIAQAEAYFDQWYGADTLTWLNQFRFKKTEELELLATVDMARAEITGKAQVANLAAVKSLIANDPEWRDKLTREIFSDAHIEAALAECRRLFG